GATRRQRRRQLFHNRGHLADWSPYLLGDPTNKATGPSQPHGASWSPTLRPPIAPLGTAAYLCVDAVSGAICHRAQCRTGAAASASPRAFATFPSLRHLAANSSRATLLSWSPVSSACSSQRAAWWKHSDADNMMPSTV